MNRDEFLSRLKKHEWTDFECKKAQGGVPDAAYDTVSAFANTTGGYLVFGVQEKKGVLEIVGVSDVDKVQNDFLSCLRAGAKLNHPVQKNAFIIPDQADLVTDQPGKKSGNMVTDQPRQNGAKWPSKRLTKLTPQQARIIKMCSEPRSQAFLMNDLGVTHRDFFRKTHLKPLMEANLVRMSFPDEPKHPNQAYVLTDAGKKLLASQKSNVEDQD